VVGAIFDDTFARIVRSIGLGLGVTACLTVLCLPSGAIRGVPTWTLEVYPFAMALLLAGYGWLVRLGPARLAAALILLIWMISMICRGYSRLRDIVVGLDYFALSMLLFALAVLVSLIKAGVLAHWWEARRAKSPPSTA
jgi:hypothetical protein